MLATPAAQATQRFIKGELERKPFSPLMEMYSLVTDALDAGMTLEELRWTLVQEVAGRIPAPVKNEAKTAVTISASGGGRSA